MFIASRIANGIIALLASLISLLLFTGAGLAMRPAAALLACVVVFFIIDLILRQKGSTSDTVFTTLWILLFSYTIYDSLEPLSSMIANPMYAEPLGGPIVVVLTVSLINGVPLLLNSMYLVRLLRQNRIQA